MLQDARFALRFLARNPLFTAASVLVLALGIGLSAALAAFIHGALLTPWPYRGYERIVSVQGSYPELGRTDYSLWSPDEIADLSAEHDIFEFVIAGNARNLTISRDGRPERVRAAVLSPAAFAMLAVPALIGRTLTDADADVGAPPVLVVSYGFWRDRLGGEVNAVGRSIDIASTPYTIVGVMPERFAWWDREMWLPLALESAARTDRRHYVQAQLRQGIDIKQASVVLAAVSRRLAADHSEVREYRGLRINIRPLTDAVSRELRPASAVLLAAVALVLIVAVANVTTLWLLKYSAREAEFAVRRAIGGTAGRITRQLLCEGLVIGAAACAIGVTAASAALPHMVAAVPYGYIAAEAQVRIEPRTLAVAAALALLSALAVALLTARRAVAAAPGELLKKNDARTGAPATQRWREVFSAMQCALAVAIGGLGIAAVAGFHARVEDTPGFDARAIQTTRVAPPATASPDERSASYERVVSELKLLPGVSGAAAASELPAGELPRTLIRPSGDDSRAVDVDQLAISPEFMALLRVPLIDGRAFEEADDARRSAVVIVTASLARRLWNREDAVTREVTVGDGPDRFAATVIGVAADIRVNPSLDEPRPLILLPLRQRPSATAALLMRSDGVPLSPERVRAAVDRVDASMPLFGDIALEDARVNVLGPLRLATILLGVFTLATFGLFAIGIYGVASQSVQERERETRIRLALGATREQVFSAELRRRARWLTLAAIAGAAASTAGTRLAGSYIAAFASAGWWATPVATVVIVGTAVAATAVPAWRAGRVERARLL